MTYFNRLLALAIVAALSTPCFAQFPGQPSKGLPQPALPSKSTPLASPQADTFASPQQQQSFAPIQQYEQPAVVLRAVPQVYAVQRQVVLAAPAVSYASVAYDTGCVAQQAVVQRGFVQHSAVVNHGIQQAQVNHGLVAGAGRQPKKIITKQVTRVKRGLFGK